MRIHSSTATDALCMSSRIQPVGTIMKTTVWSGRATPYEKSLLPFRFVRMIDPVLERLHAAALVHALVFAQARLDQVAVLLVDRRAQQVIDQHEKQQRAAGEDRGVAKAEPQAERAGKISDFHA